MHKITNVKVLPNYKVRLEYSNGVKGVADLCPDALYLQITNQEPEVEGDECLRFPGLIGSLSRYFSMIIIQHTFMLSMVNMRF